VLGFKNLSGKTDVAWISPALSQMLGTELTAGEKLRIIPSEQVTHGKIDLALPDEDSLGRDSLTRVRNNMGSDFVVLGSFLDMGGQIRIDLSLQNAVAGETVATISESGPEKDLPELATRAGERLRHKLGVADPSADDTARTKASQSPSLVATRLYSEGLQKLHSFDSLAARDLLERAIAEDPNYALAHSALAEAWRSLGYGDKSTAEAKKAMDLSGSLSRENVLAIEAQYRNSRHEIVREAEIYKTLFDFYPDNLEFGFSLAISQFFNAQFREANSTLDTLQQLPSPQGDDPRIDKVRAEVAIATGDYKKALVLAERVELRAQQRGARRLAAEALSDQCTLLSKLGDPSRASAVCDKSRVIFSDIGDLRSEALVWGQIAHQSADRGDLHGGRTANERQIALLKKVEDDSGLGWAMNVAGELSADSGDYQRALQEFNEALNLYQKVGYQSGVISCYGNVGYVNSLQGDLTDAVTNYEQAIALTRRTNSKGEMDLWLEGLAEVLLDKGDVPDATKHMEEGFRINTETGDKRVGIYLHTARSKLLFAQGELNESRREAELAIKSCLDINDEGGARERRLLLARLDIAQNHSQTAAEALRKILSDSKTEPDGASQIEARALLIEALLTMPSVESKREVVLLSKVAPNTQNVSLRLAGNLQIARSRFALGDRVGALDLLEEVISESKRLGYEAAWLEARLARAEMELQSGVAFAGREQIEKIAKQAEAMGLKLIANKARSLLK
jgi:tetratricopeptide (TPR) repeat protein